MSGGRNPRNDAGELPIFSNTAPGNNDEMEIDSSVPTMPPTILGTSSHSEPLNATHPLLTLNLHHHTFDDTQSDQHSLYTEDHDSAYDSASLLGDDTDTLASFITDYRYENGRRYHSFRDGAYWGPNDDRQNELVDLAHHMYLITLDGNLHLAPIGEGGVRGNVHEILDIGTGTGIWAIDMADEYPSARVTGTDLSPIQPDFVPPNCSFEIDDVTLEWTFPDDRFDFIHIREMFGCIPDWDFFLQQAWRCLKPGGWVEIVEHSVWPVSDDPRVGPDHFYNTWGTTVEGLGERWGKTFRIWRQSRDKVVEAGFTEVVERRFKWPIGGWHHDPKMREVGMWNQLRMMDGVEGFMLRLLTGPGGMSIHTAQAFLGRMREELRNPSNQSYQAGYGFYLDGSVVYARKPL
ncbi:MAG: hypothetical protein M1820_002153 [Bogoriella megaspora]|nr:MAG: hypothetical protein M1820_002153 [Bogoriella megaspora]